jgi:hypothetical protein
MPRYIALATRAFGEGATPEAALADLPADVAPGDAVVYRCGPSACVDNEGHLVFGPGDVVPIRVRRRSTPSAR